MKTPCFFLRLGKSFPSADSTKENTIDCRRVCILGASIGGLGFGLSALAANKWVFIFLYGVVGGMGLGTMYVPSIVVVSQYFKAKRGLATGQSNMVSVLIINFAIFHWV